MVEIKITISDKTSSDLERYKKDISVESIEEAAISAIREYLTRIGYSC